MIEMNMCYHYGAEYWKTACLTVNAGLEGELEKGADYGTVSKAVNSVKDIVELPDINSSEMEFIPKDGKIMYGLKPIIGLGTAAIETVIKNRPYSSVQDFYEKNIESEEMPVSKAIVLVKSGAFHNISDSHKSAAIELVNCHIKPKNKLTTVQLPKIINKVYAAKKEFKDELTLFKFRQSIKGKTKVPMNEKIERYFMNNLSDKVEYDFDDKGILQIDIKSFDKYFNKATKELKEWLKTDEAIKIYATYEKEQFWIENFSGSPESWEMETIMFYSDKHEIDYVPFLKDMNIVNFYEMEQEKVKSTYKTRSGTTRNVFETENIAGTVVDKNKQKSLIYLLTKYGVVTVRVPKYKFEIYNKKVIDIDKDGNKTILDSSWFDRGTSLLCTGYRRGEEFVLYKPNKNTKELFKIEKGKDNYYLQSDKKS